MTNRLITLGVGILLGLPLLHAQAPTIDSLPAQQLPDVVISENRLQLPFGTLSRLTHVLTRQQLSTAPVNSVAELLQSVPGLDVRQRGAHGVQADLSIRGSTFDQTLVLINGIPLSDPQTGHHLLNLPVDLPSIDRVEVVKGPASRVFGQNAMAGAVNLITEVPNRRFSRLAVEAGEHGLGVVSFSAALPQGNGRHYFSFSKQFSEGYRYNTDYDINTLFYQSALPVGGRELQLLASYTERSFGANGFYASPQFTDQFERVHTSLGAVSYPVRTGQWEITPRLYWRRNEDEYIFVRNNPSLYRNVHIGHVVGAEVNSRRTGRWGQTGLGLHSSLVSLRSNNLGRHQRTTLTAFIEHRFSLLADRLTLTPGASINYFSDFGTQLFPGAELGWRLSGQTRLFANAGYTYRVPTFTDRFYEDRANEGNPDLQPESALAYELGARWLRDAWLVQGAYFRRSGNDQIDWVKTDTTADSRWRPINFRELVIQGFEAEVEWQPATRLQRLGLSYTYITAELPLVTEYPLSRYALGHLRHQLIGTVVYRPLARWSHSVQVRYADRTALEDYTVIDTRLSYQLRRSRIFVQANNLFDAQYTETSLVPMPGRWLRMGIHWQWD